MAEDEVADSERERKELERQEQQHVLISAKHTYNTRLSTLYSLIVADAVLISLADSVVTRQSTGICVFVLIIQLCIRIAWLGARLASS